MTIGYLASSFDMINVRDLDVIAQANALCTRLVVGVFTDEFAEDQHGRRPVVPLSERVALLQHIRGVDRVVVHSGEALQSVLGVDDDHVTFTISDEGTLATSGDRVELTPGRTTSSLALRNALNPARSSAVA